MGKGRGRVAEGVWKGKRMGRRGGSLSLDLASMRSGIRSPRSRPPEPGSPGRRARPRPPGPWPRPPGGGGPGHMAGPDGTGRGREGNFAARAKSGEGHASVRRGDRKSDTVSSKPFMM